jgi:hypothetical protein
VEVVRSDWRASSHPPKIEYILASCFDRDSLPSCKDPNGQVEGCRPGIWIASVYSTAIRDLVRRLPRINRLVTVPTGDSVDVVCMQYRKTPPISNLCSSFDMSLGVCKPKKMQVYTTQ